MLVRITGPNFTAHLVIKRGFCTDAEPALAYCLGASAPWIKGHIIFKKWRGVIVPDQDAPLAQTELRL